MHALRLLAAGLLTLVPAAAAKPPPAGLLVPGQSLGGLRLGMSPPEVKETWGSDYGRCRACPHMTWYYNYAVFEPKGAGIEFRSGRVAAIFTLWAPVGWHTTKRLRIGDPETRVAQLYGGLPQVHCKNYDATTILQPGKTSSIYVREDKVWGFGLSRAGVPVCR